MVSALGGAELEQNIKVHIIENDNCVNVKIPKFQYIFAKNETIQIIDTTQPDGLQEAFQSDCKIDFFELFMDSLH